MHFLISHIKLPALISRMGWLQIVIFDRIYGLSGSKIFAGINSLMSDTQFQKGMLAGSEDYRNYALDHQNKKPEPRNPMSLSSYLISKQKDGASEQT